MNCSDIYPFFLFLLYTLLLTFWWSKNRNHSDFLLALCFHFLKTFTASAINPACQPIQFPSKSNKFNSNNTRKQVPRTCKHTNNHINKQTNKPAVRHMSEKGGKASHSNSNNDAPILMLRAGLIIYRQPNQIISQTDNWSWQRRLLALEGTCRVPLVVVCLWKIYAIIAAGARDKSKDTGVPYHHSIHAPTILLQRLPLRLVSAK